MKPIRSLIVDDEKWCRSGIRLMLEDTDDFEVIGECRNGKEAIDSIHSEKPDLVFLDISMPEINGFDVIKAVGADKMPLVIFVTAFNEYAIKAFEVHALDYILKPFSRKRFLQTLERARQRIDNLDVSQLSVSMQQLMYELASKQAQEQVETRETKQITIQDNNSLKIISVREIEWIEGADYYVNLHCTEKSYLHRERLKNMEAKLTTSTFVRIHRSAIINIEHLDRIIQDHQHQHLAVMKSGATVKISRTRYPKLLERINS